MQLTAELQRLDVSTLADDPSREAFAAAVTSLKARDLDVALASFVQCVRLNRRYQDEAARKACLALFTLLGDTDELTKKHRRALEMALF